MTAYSKVLNDYELEYLGEKINLNIGIKYNEDDGRTLIYIATPIIKLDY
ncbi:YwmB family TATA-box binding protein [Clostridioides difficile]|nr:YwmB family TATA-box binding protein [Clostridioides difficile]